MTDDSKHPRVVTPAKRSSTAQDGNALPQNGSDSKRVKEGHSSPVSSSGSDEEEGSLSAYSWPVYGGCHPKPLPEVHAIVRATMARTVRERGNAQGKDAREETITSDNENERQLRRVEHHPDAPMTEPCVVIQTKRSSTAQNGNDVPSHDGNRAKRAKPATPSNSVVPVVDETSEDDEEPPPFELERISENKANKSSSTLTIAIKGLKTDRRGNTTYEAFEVDTVEGKVELGSNLQKVVNSLLCGAMEQMRTNAQQDDFEEDAETIETEDDGDSGERQIPRDQYHPNAPMTEENQYDNWGPLGDEHYACKSACPAKGRKSKDHFCCSQIGKSCSADCDCKGTCNNAFNATIKNRLFGSDPDFYGRELPPNACFVKWFAKRSKAQQRPRTYRHGVLVAILHLEAKMGYMDTSMRPGRSTQKVHAPVGCSFIASGYRSRTPEASLAPCSIRIHR